MSLIRQKITGLYATEPDPKEEILDANEAGRHRSKHQEFMQQLSTSGKSLAEIQTAWHSYYVNLPDEEKHAVWQEFYQMHGNAPHLAPSNDKPAKPAASHHQPAHHAVAKARPSSPRSVADIKSQLLSKVAGKGSKLSKKQHVHSLVFGAAMGVMMLAFLLFGFFNERFVAPFVTPSRTVSTTPIIIDPNSTTVGNDPKVIIPKINVEIPVVYDQTSIDEAAIQKSLEQGVVHYSTTSSPGQKGNSVIFGHSSNNIFNKGKYKFAFVLLSHLEIGDTFTLTKDGKQYVYKIYEKRVVKPNDISVLNPIADKTATATLITCDPPGTSLNRLIVVGEQISPDPATDSESTAVSTDKQPTVVPSNAPSLWHRFTQWLSR